MRVEEHTIELDGSPVFFRTAPTADPQPLYLHGIPTSADDWTELLGRTGGLAPDLLGFGRTGKGGQLDLTVEGHVDFLEQLLDAAGVRRVQLVAHDWGAAGGLLFAQRHPQRVERLILIDALPMIEDFPWPPSARIWRRRLLGELTMGAVTERLLARRLRQGTVSADVWTPQRVQEVWRHFDQGTQRAILRLHRSLDEDRRRQVAEGLAALTMPALVLWGERDPWWPTAVGEEYARRLPAAQLVRLPDTGHWPWLERPEALEQVVSFLGRA